MFMGGSFCETPFVSLPSITVNGEIFYFDFGIDQSYPTIFNITQIYHATGMHIKHNSTFDLVIDRIDTFDLNIDQLENSNFLR